MTWDALHKLAGKQRKTEKRKREITYTFFWTICNSFLEAPSINRVFGNAIESRFREKIFDPIALFQIQFGKKKELEQLFSGTKLMLAAMQKGLGHAQ